MTRKSTCSEWDAILRYSGQEEEIGPDETRVPSIVNTGSGTVRGKDGNRDIWTNVGEMKTPVAPESIIARAETGGVDLERRN